MHQIHQHSDTELAVTTEWNTIVILYH